MVELSKLRFRGWDSPASPLFLFVIPPRPFPAGHVVCLSVSTQDQDHAFGYKVAMMELGESPRGVSVWIVLLVGLVVVFVWVRPQARS